MEMRQWQDKDGVLGCSWELNLACQVPVRFLSGSSRASVVTSRSLATIHSLVVGEAREFGGGQIRQLVMVNTNQQSFITGSTTS